MGYGFPGGGFGYGPYPPYGPGFGCGSFGPVYALFIVLFILLLIFGFWWFISCGPIVC
ncbi:sporulation protein YjcZ [Bacillus cihuensis]|uniref:sporulation protein YjcZ n=1 Tax=Bacillus cihuensis TaxID=1208599 RepID=UPI00040B2024|nr:sporulation protein YjcZ [Bacillus cihuensis]